MLNDDDEDVREIAASAASAILSSEGTLSSVLMNQSPLAASEKLAIFLGDNFRDERLFHIAALKRIWFSSTSTRENWNFEQEITKCSVKVLLESLQRDSNALFEEERQNLYIDDIREAEIWSRILKITRPPEEDCLNSVGDWVLTGLRDLRNHLNDNVDFDGPLGLTSQSDTLKLFVRVITLAAVTLDWASRKPAQVQELRFTGASNTVPPLTPVSVHDRSNEASLQSHWTVCMSLELGALEKLGRRLCIHERIMHSIEDITKKQ